MVFLLFQFEASTLCKNATKECHKVQKFGALHNIFLANLAMSCYNNKAVCLNLCNGFTYQISINFLCILTNKWGVIHES